MEVLGLALSEGVLAAEHSLSLLNGQRSQKGARRDTIRNKRRLLAAASELIRDGSDLNMQNVADRADIAIATAYRHFSSAEALVNAYVLTIIDDLIGYSAGCKATGRELISSLLDHWIGLIQEHGHVMVNFRSRHGFFERLNAKDPVVLLVQVAWGRPISEYLADRHLDPSLSSHALFLCNLLFDPREVLDLMNEAGHSRRELGPRLLSSMDGALSGWAALAD
ncbi:TetR/AcrR family transcriptional regulator [Rhodococcus sp. IEGM1428]|uniref:TetR/AcrR family transcriptional regulator n=1 Tax=Rhodococcus sp. IEGM1428 TaxID=3392191 RepID=UPI003D0E9282